tara:strand:- start:5099 stop:5278 length:180 start_codon:yes stop_codon:yes gene_type:complete
MILNINLCISQFILELNLFSQTSDAVFIEMVKTVTSTNNLKQALSISTLLSTYEREKVH